MSSITDTPHKGDPHEGDPRRPGSALARFVPIPGEAVYLPDRLARIPGLFEVPLASRPPGASFVYVACHLGASPPGHPPALVPDYVGLTTSLGKRLSDHALMRTRERMRPLARAFAVAVYPQGPQVTPQAVEEALIRVIATPYNRPRASGVRASDLATLRAWGYDTSGIDPDPVDTSLLRGGFL